MRTEQARPVRLQDYRPPDWLVDREMLKTMVPRVRVHEMWRVK